MDVIAVELEGWMGQMPHSVDVDVAVFVAVAVAVVVEVEADFEVDFKIEVDELGSVSQLPQAVNVEVDVDVEEVRAVTVELELGLVGLVDVDRLPALLPVNKPLQVVVGKHVPKVDHAGLK